MSPRGAPGRGERGYVDPFARATFDVRHGISEAIRLFSDHELGPMLMELLASEGYFLDYEGDLFESEDRFFELADLPGLMEIPEASTEDAAHILFTAFDAMGSTPDTEEVPGFVQAAIVEDALAATGKPTIVSVDKDEAVAFVKAHHSAFPQARTKGLLYAIGVKFQRRLVAVALANSPSAGYRSRSCPQAGILDLSRIASDRSLKGASSMLAARLIDLLGESGRHGEKGCLFVTYSLLSEKGTSYLALAEKGLRPVGISRGKKPTGARGKRTLAPANAAKPEEDKIIWEAGPAALPPKWSVLERTIAEPHEIARARSQFEKVARERVERERAKEQARARQQRGARGVAGSGTSGDIPESRGANPVHFRGHPGHPEQVVRLDVAVDDPTDPIPPGALAQVAFARDFPSLRMTMTQDYPIGSGGNGTVWAAGNRIVKVTRDPLELALVEAAKEDGRFDGFARVMQGPVERRGGRSRDAPGLPAPSAYVREAVTPVPPVEMLVCGIYTASHLPGRYALDISHLREVRRTMPGIADFIQRLFERGVFVTDIASNIGRREDGSLVMYDGQLTSVPEDC